MSACATLLGEGKGNRLGEGNENELGGGKENGLGEGRKNGLGEGKEDFLQATIGQAGLRPQFLKRPFAGDPAFAQ